MFCFFRGFEQLSSSIGRQIMTEQSQSQYSGFAVLAGKTFLFFNKMCQKLEIAPVHIMEMTIQHIGHISSRHTLKCPAYDIHNGQKKDFKKWISRKTISNYFQDSISNNILR